MINLTKYLLIFILQNLSLSYCYLLPKCIQHLTVSGGAWSWSFSMINVCGLTCPFQLIVHQHVIHRAWFWMNLMTKTNLPCGCLRKANLEGPSLLLFKLHFASLPHSFQANWAKCLFLVCFFGKKDHKMNKYIFSRSLTGMICKILAIFLIFICSFSHFQVSEFLRF